MSNIPQNEKLNSILTEFLTSRPIRIIEDEIIWTMKMCEIKKHNNINAESLLRARKKMINDFVLNYQKELLPVIVNFNENLTKNMRKLYDEAESAYNLMTKIYKDNNLQVQGCCYFNGGYPKKHPLQNDMRQELWEALTDEDNNPIYADGAADILFKYLGDRENAPKLLSSADLETWESYEPPSAFIKRTLEEFFFIGTDTENWNEGLDENLTKDLHLVHPFHNLFEHSNFALTDFIYCRNYNFNISAILIYKEVIYERQINTYKTRRVALYDIKNRRKEIGQTAKAKSQKALGCQVY